MLIEFKAMPMIRKFSYLLSLFIAFASVSAMAEQDKAAKNSETEFPVTLDVIVDEIRDISIGNANFEIVAEALLTWTLPELRGRVSVPRTIIGSSIDETLADTWDPGVFISNALQPRTTVARSLTMYPDGSVKLYEKFSALVSIDNTMPTYPFGEIDLHLEIQSINHPLPEFVFVPRTFELGHHGNSDIVSRGNWSLHDRRTEVIETSSLSHGGASRFSVAVLHMALAHDFIDSAQKIFLPLISIMFLSIAINMFMVNYEKGAGGDNALWLSSGQLTLLLTLFALKFTLRDEIPVTHYITMIDALFISASLLVILSLIWGMYVINVLQSGRIEFAQRLKKKSFLIFVLLAVGSLSWIFTFLLK